MFVCVKKKLRMDMNEPESKRLRMEGGVTYGISGLPTMNSTSPDYQNAGSYGNTPPIGGGNNGGGGGGGETNFASSLPQESNQVFYVAKTKQLLDMKEVYLNFIEFLHSKTPELRRIDPSTQKPSYPPWFISQYVWAVKIVDDLDNEIYTCFKEIQLITAAKDSLLRNSSYPLRPLITVRTPGQTPFFVAGSVGSRGKKLETTPFRKSSLANPNFESECLNGAEWETEGIRELIASVNQEVFGSDKVNELKSVVEDIVHMLASLRTACNVGDPLLLHTTTPLNPQNSKAHDELNGLARKVFETNKVPDDKK